MKVLVIAVLLRDGIFADRRHLGQGHFSPSSVEWPAVRDQSPATITPSGEGASQFARTVAEPAKIR
jgi:hypothetical protein